MSDVERRERSAHRAVVFNVLGYALSFANSVLIVRRFGATSATDAYFLTLAIPSALVSIFGASMAGAVQAVLARYHVRQRRRQLLIALAIAPSASLGLLALIHPLLRAPGVLTLMGAVQDPGTARLAASWFSVCSMGAMLCAISLVLAAALQASGRYAAAASLPVISSSVQTLVLVALWARGPIVLPGGYLGAQLTAVLVAAAFSRRTAAAESTQPTPSSRALVTSLSQLAWPIMSGSIIGSLVMLLQRAIAAKFPAGELSAFSFGWTLGNVPMLLFGFLLGAPAVTEIAMRASSTPRIAAQARWLLVLSFALLTPTGGWLAASAPDVIAILYGDRLGVHRDTAISVVRTLGVATVVQTPLIVLARVFAGSGDSRTPTVCGVAGIVCGAAAMLPLSHAFAARGLAYAYVVETVVSTTAIVYASLARWPTIAADNRALSGLAASVLASSFVGHWLALLVGGGDRIGVHIARALITLLGTMTPLLALAATTDSGRSIVARVLKGRLPIAPPAEQDVGAAVPAPGAQ